MSTSERKGFYSVCAIFSYASFATLGSSANVELRKSFELLHVLIIWHTLFAGARQEAIK